jgi:hypothetical protein
MTGAEMFTHLFDIGLKVEPHHRHFVDNEDDDIWIADVSKRGWVIFSADTKAIYVYRDTILQSGAFFIALDENHSGPRYWASAITVAMPKILRLIDSQPRPCILKLLGNGKIEVFYKSELRRQTVATAKRASGITRRYLENEE